jgi:trigger factor
LQVTINTLSEVQQEADIQVANEELQPHFEEAYAKYRPKLEMRGFRKGKVPLPIIKKVYGEAIEREALDTIADTIYHKAMEERNIRPLGQPTMVDMDYKRGGEFHFRIKYDVKPQIALKDYKGIALEKPVHTVSEAEIEEEVLHLRRVHSSSEDVVAVTDDEHIVTADIQELDEAGSPLVGRKSSNTKFNLWDSTLVPQLRDVLRKAEKGQTCSVSYESQHEDHAHKTHLGVSVTKIEKQNLPPFDEALVSKITGGKVTSADEFRKNMGTDLERYWQERAESRLEDELTSEIVRRHEFTAPESLVNAVLESYIDDIRSRSKDKKLPVGFDENKFREERRVYAVWQAKWMLLKEQIADAEGIAVTDEDIAQLAETDAPKMGLSLDKLLSYYKTSDRIRERLLSDKIMAFLKRHAKITEKEVKA